MYTGVFLPYHCAKKRSPSPVTAGAQTRPGSETKTIAVFTPQQEPTLQTILWKRFDSRFGWWLL